MSTSNFTTQAQRQFHVLHSSVDNLEEEDRQLLEALQQSIVTANTETLRTFVISNFVTGGSAATMRGRYMSSQPAEFVQERAEDDPWAPTIDILTNMLLNSASMNMATLHANNARGSDGHPDRHGPTGPLYSSFHS